jgi:hypothetical protein
MKRLTVAALGALAIAAGVAGCSGGSDDASAAPTKAQFFKNANEICSATEKRIQAQILAYAEKFKGKEPTDPAALASIRKGLGETIVIPARTQEAEEMNAIGIPPEDKKRATAIVKSLEEGVETAKEDPLDTVDDGTKAFGKFWMLARAYGLKGC